MAVNTGIIVLTFYVKSRDKEFSGCYRYIDGSLIVPEFDANGLIATY